MASVDHAPIEMNEMSEQNQQHSQFVLLVGVGLAAFALGGFAIGVGFLWRFERAPHKHPTKKAAHNATGKTPRLAPRPRKRLLDGGAPQKRAAKAPVRPLSRKPQPVRKHPQSDQKKPAPARRRAKATNAGSGQMWGAPNWIFNPKGGLIGQLRLLTVTEVKRALGFAHLRGAILQGIPRSGVYDAVQYKPTKPIPKAPKARFGLGFQLWLHPQATPILQRWKRYQRGYPNASIPPPTQRVGRDVFVAKRAPIHYILFRTSRRHGLVILSCHEALCSRPAMLKLARLIDARIQ